MGFGKVIHKFMQMKKNGSMAGQAGQRIMKEGGSTTSDDAKERALAELKEEKDRKAMGKAYDEAASRSMGTFKEKAPKPPAPASAASSPMSKAKGGAVKNMAKGGVTRGDGCAQRGKTRGRNV